MDDFDKIVAEQDKVSEENKASVVSSGEINEFLQYIMGDSSQPPVVLDKMMNNLMSKLSMGLGMVIVGNITRQQNLSKFIQAAEDSLFNKEMIETLDRDELVKLHSSANRSLESLQEFQRKFLVQNKDAFRSNNTPQEKLMNQIMALSPDKTQQMITYLSNLNEPVSTSSEPAAVIAELVDGEPGI